jgi:CelD/BcsL family acetyltransferase involved in cellulose biosynthesis
MATRVLDTIDTDLPEHAPCGAADTALPLRVGARTLWTLRRRLVRRRLPLAEALGHAPPSLPPLGADADGYLINALPEEWLGGIVASRGELRPFVRQRYRRSYARLDLDFDAWLGGFSAKSRSTMKRKVRRLADASGGAPDVRCYRSEAEIALFHRIARGLSERTYQERLLGAGLPDGAAALAQMQSLARAGRVRGWLLFLTGRPIAYLYAPAEGETLIYAHLGYDPDFAELSPGTVLQLEAMRQLMHEKAFRLFDFTEGESEHKRRFATGGIESADLLLLRPSPGNLIVGHSLGAFDRGVALAKSGCRALGLVRRGGL